MKWVKFTTKSGSGHHGTHYKLFPDAYDEELITEWYGYHLEEEAIRDHDWLYRGWEWCYENPTEGYIQSEIEESEGIIENKKAYIYELQKFL